MPRSRMTVSSLLALGVAAGAVSAPAHAQGGLVFKPVDPSLVTAPPPPPSVGVVVKPPVPPAAVVTPSPAPPMVVVAPPVDSSAVVNVEATYSPSALNLGVVRAYKNEQGAAILSVNSPTAGTVSARLQPAGPFRVIRMTSYEYGAWAPGTPGTSTSGADGMVVSQRRVVSTTTGGSLAVKAGQSLEVEVALQPTAETPAYPRATLSVSGHQWSIHVPVGATVEKQPEIAVAPLTDAVKIAVNEAREIPIRLTRHGSASNLYRAPVARNVTITARSLPAGVTMEPLTVPVPADAKTVDAKLVIRTNEFTPLASWETAAFLVDTGADRQVIEMDAHVYPASMSWPYHRKVGELVHEGILTIHSNGNWWWKATVRNEQYMMGAWYSVFIDYIHPNAVEDKAPWLLEYGQLGSRLVGENKVEIEQSSDNDRYLGQGPNQWLRENYFNAVDKGIKIRTRYESDPTTIAKFSVMAVPEIIGWLKDGVD